MRNGCSFFWKILNSGKPSFLSMAASVVIDVNAMRDGDGIRYARKAMIRIGLSCYINGELEEAQLFPRLREIIRKYRTHFEGAPIVGVEDQ